jgi:hypothetical protein
MRPFGVGNVVLVVLIFLLTIAPGSAVSPNPNLVALVPPTARMVAGMIAPQRGRVPTSFMLITHNNLLDLNDFITLSGADNSRVIEQIIMVASDGGGGMLTEHSLLASGHFDQGLIYRSANRSVGASAAKYRGIPVLVVQPFARESDSFHDVRWLAVMDSNLAVFGTVASVQQELDRHLDHSVADPALGRRLAHLRRDDATWCVATLPDHNGEIQSAFEMLDARLAELLRPGDTLEFGTHYGRQVEFEYEVGLASSHDVESVLASLQPPVTGSSLLPVAELIKIDGGIRAVLKVSKDRYEAWKAGVVAAQSDLPAVAVSSNR